MDPVTRLVFAAAGRLAEGFVYSVSADETVRKIDAQGNQVWSVQRESAINAVAVDQDGFVYTTQSNGRLRKFDPDGVPIWSFISGSTINATRAVAVDADGFVYICGTDTFKVSPVGAQVWRYIQVSGSSTGIAVDEDGFVYIASGNSRLDKVSPTGSLVWGLGGGGPPLGVRGGRCGRVRLCRAVLWSLVHRHCKA